VQAGIERFEQPFGSVERKVRQRVRPSRAACEFEGGLEMIKAVVVPASQRCLDTLRQSRIAVSVDGVGGQSCCLRVRIGPLDEIDVELAWEEVFDVGF
jgi:hypothetical protein